MFACSLLQALIDSKVVPHAIKLHGIAGPKTLCETLRIITNIINKGTADHVRYLVAQGGVAGLCQVLDRELLLEQESFSGAWLHAMERILRIGQEDATRSGTGNAHAQMVQKSAGVEKLTALKEGAKGEETRSRIETLLKTYFP
ncbi:importin subunit alpha-5-like [Diadema setosum]|uniref:importin subunit alpha-5-like n=1 Tax=Diadema setosum TaxID=31175 RepID=UPI003B3A8A4E